MAKNKTLWATCSLCGNKSGYDKQSLKGSTWNINGIDHVLCCFCEDDLWAELKKRRINKRTGKEWS
jgi:hypothetical protein